MKKILSIGLLIGVIVLFVFYLTRDSEHMPETDHVQDATPLAPVTEEDITVFDGKNSVIVIEGTEVTLKNGVSEITVAGTPSIITTTYFGNEAYGDLDGDGADDVAYLITQNTGGTGTFYYVVVALQTEDGYTNTNAFFIGDRIAPQSTEINSDSRELHVNYADRKEGEPYSVPPSVGKVLLLKVVDGQLKGLME